MELFIIKDSISDGELSTVKPILSLPKYKFLAKSVPETVAVTFELTFEETFQMYFQTDAELVANIF